MSQVPRVLLSFVCSDRDRRRSWRLMWSKYEVVRLQLLSLGHSSLRLRACDAVFGEISTA